MYAYKGLGLDFPSIKNVKNSSPKEKSQPVDELNALSFDFSVCRLRKIPCCVKGIFTRRHIYCFYCKKLSAIGLCVYAEKQYIIYQ